MTDIEKKQVELIDKIINVISESHDTMFASCQERTKNMHTDQANEIYNKDYEEFNELLFDMMQKLSIYGYKIEHPEYKNNK